MDKGSKSPLGKIVFEVPSGLSEPDRIRERKLKEIQDQFLADFHLSQKQALTLSDIKDSEVLKVSPTQLRATLNKYIFENGRREEKLRELKAVCVGMKRNAESLPPGGMKSLTAIIRRAETPMMGAGTPVASQAVIPYLQDLITKTLSRVETEEFTCEQLTRLWEKTNLTLVSRIQAELKQRIEHLRVVHRRLFTKMDEIVTMKTNANNKMYQASHSLSKLEEELTAQRTRREEKVENMRWKIEDTEYEYKRISKELAQRVLKKQVRNTQEADVRNEQLVQGVASASAIHDAQKMQNMKSTRVLQGIEAAFIRIRDLINSSAFFNLKSPLTSVTLDDSLKYFAQLSYQVLSLNTKFAALSETESTQMLELKQLTSELDALKANNSRVGRLIEHINQLWTRQGHEPMQTTSQFKHALETLDEEAVGGELEESLETFLITINLSGIEVCRRLVTLLQYIEQHSSLHMSGVETSIARLVLLVGQTPIPPPKPLQQPIPELQPPKKFRPLATRKTTNFISSSRSSGGFPPVPKTVSEIELDSTPKSQQSSEILQVMEDSHRDVLVESGGLEEEEVEEVIKASNRVPLIRLFLSKGKFRTVVLSTRSAQPADFPLTLVSSLLTEAHSAMKDQYYRRIAALETLLAAIESDSLFIEQQFSSVPMTESQLMQFISDRQDLQRIADGFESGERRHLSESTKAILEVKMQTLTTQQIRRNSILKTMDLGLGIPIVKSDPIFPTQEDTDQTELVVATQEQLLAERSRYKSRTSGTASAQKTRISVFKGTESIAQKIERLSKMKKGPELERGLIEQTQSISERMRVILESGKVNVEKESEERYLKHSRTVTTLPSVRRFTHSVTFSDRISPNR